MELINEGLGIRSKVDKEYHYPILPILDTEEILEKIGREWKVSEPSKYSDRIFLQWVGFLDLAAQGRQIGVNTIQGKGMAIDQPEIDTYLCFYRAMGPGKDYSETIPSIRIAFAMLLSPTARQTVDKEMKNVQVDHELRNQINTLFKGVARQLGVVVGTPLK